MSWRVFGLRYAELYLALLKERCVRDGFGADPETLAQQFRLYLHRGNSYPFGNKQIRKNDDLIALAVSALHKAAWMRL
jgi:DNA sulfur modification protein DndE